MGNTPLIYAADAGSVEIVAALIKRGAIPDDVNNVSAAVYWTRHC